MDLKTPSPRSWAVMMGGVALTAVAICLPTWSYSLVSDDLAIVADHPAVVGDAAWHSVWTSPYWPVKYPGDPLYRPLTLLSLRWDRWLASDGNEVVVHRMSSTLLYAATCALTAVLAAAAWRSWMAGWAAGLLFAVHPLHAEVVGLVVGRSELLAGLFVSTLFVHRLSSLTSLTQPKLKGHVLMAVLYFLGLISKENAVFAGIGIAAIDCFYAKTIPGETLRKYLERLAASHYLGLILALAGYLLLRWNVFEWRTRLAPDHIDPFSNPLAMADWTVQVLTPFALTGLSAELWFVPMRVCPLWSIGGFVPPLAMRWDVLLGAVVLVFLATTSIRGLILRRPSGWLTAILLAFLLLPTHAIPAANWLFAERWLYTATIPAAVLCVGWIPRAPRLGFVIVPLVGAALTIQTLRYQPCWRDNDALFTAALSRHPQSYHALLGVAELHRQRGELHLVSDVVDRLVTYHPLSPQSWYYRALGLGDEADPVEVLDAIDRMMKLSGYVPPPADIVDLQQRALARRREDS